MFGWFRRKKKKQEPDIKIAKEYDNLICSFYTMHVAFQHRVLAELGIVDDTGCMPASDSLFQAKKYNGHYFYSVTKPPNDILQIMLSTPMHKLMMLYDNMTPGIFLGTLAKLCADGRKYTAVAVLQGIGADTKELDGPFEELEKYTKYAKYYS